MTIVSVDKRKKRMNLHQSICQLLHSIGDGCVTQSPYDTAWVARLSELGEPIGEEALEWLRAHQLADGSWGASQIRYHHDRLICTLAAMTALAKYGRNDDRDRLRRAQMTLGTSTKRLLDDPAGATVGFEMIVPTLLSEAQSLGLIPQSTNGLYNDLFRYRAAKLAKLPGGMVNRFVSAAFSAELSGPDGRHILDLENLQEVNGSVGNSPSATAYFVLNISRADPAALTYLRKAVHDGSVPHMAPFDVFERAWMLWNVSLMAPLSDEIQSFCKPHVDFLEKAWQQGSGVGFSHIYTPNDCDDTSLTFDVLRRFGRTGDLQGLLSYETDGHFFCYHAEANPSIGANIHTLSALRQVGYEVTHPTIQKILSFLRRAQTMKLFWSDKWHASPYYATAHAVIACAGYDDDVVEDAIYWIIQTQHQDGSWGYYMPTAEETAYCLQALVTWKQHGHPVPADVLKRGTAWLREHAEPPYPPLWIAKCLYCPVLLVRSVIISALALVEQV